MQTLQSVTKKNQEKKKRKCCPILLRMMQQGGWKTAPRGREGFNEPPRIPGGGGLKRASSVRGLDFGRFLGAQSSFKLQQFLCSRGYAMDNLDEAQRIHPS